MDRMTIRGDHGVFLEPHWDFCIDPNDYDLLQQILGRLAIFEDLLEDQDMEPEEFVTAFKSAFTEDSLLKLTAGYLGTTPDRLREQARAEQDGRLVVLPCKIGDTVYLVRDGRVHDARIQGITLGRNNTFILNFGGYPVQYVWGSEIGKTVFLTREEAERALVADANVGHTIPVNELYDEDGGDVMKGGDDHA